MVLGAYNHNNYAFGAVATELIRSPPLIKPGIIIINIKYGRSFLPLTIRLDFDFVA